MSTQLQQYIEAETTKAEKSFRTGSIVFTVVTALLLVYFQWLNSQLHEVATPANLAKVVVSEVRRSLPTARDALKKNLAEAAPEMIRYVSDTVLNKSVPMLRLATESLFRDYMREMSLFGVEATQKIFNELVAANKDDLRAKMSQEPGVYTVESVSHDLERVLSYELGRRLTEVPAESTSFKLGRSLVALRNINVRLRNMALAPKGGRTEELGRRLITTWWTLLQESSDGESATEKLLQQKSPRTVRDLESQAE